MSDPEAVTTSRRAWGQTAAVWAGAVVFLAWLLSSHTDGELQQLLKVWQCWSLDLGVLFAGAAAVPMLKALARQVGRRDMAIMAALAVVAIALAVFVAPRTNRIFYDEQIYQAIGQNMADMRRAQVCNDGTVTSGRLACASGEYNKQPYAYPHALSLMYRLFGVRERTAFVVNAAAFAATVCVVYLIALLMFGDRVAALVAGLCLTLTPQQIAWSATAAVEPTASLASAVTVLAAVLYGRLAAVPLVVLCAMAAYGIQFRPESVLILPAIGVLIWSRLRDDLRHPDGWWAGLMFAGLAAAHIAHLYAVRNAGWGTQSARFSLDYVAPNLAVNGWFYLADERFPVAFTVLAAVGLIFRGGGIGRLALTLWFLAFLGVGLAFYAGSYNYGADVRYSLLTYPPIAIAAGAGAARLAGVIRRSVPWIPAGYAIAGLVVLQFFWYAPRVRATPEEAWAARTDVRFARDMARELPGDAYVLTHNPGMFHLWGVSAGQMSHVALNPGRMDVLTSRYPGGVYVHWNFWCNVDDPVQTAFCRQVMSAHPAVAVREHRDRDQRFAFYRVGPSS